MYYYLAQQWIDIIHFIQKYIEIFFDCNVHMWDNKYIKFSIINKFLNML